MSVIKKDGQYYVKSGTETYGPYTSASAASNADKQISGASSSSNAGSSGIDPKSNVVTTGSSEQTSGYVLRADGNWYDKSTNKLITSSRVDDNIWSQLQADSANAHSTTPELFKAGATGSSYTGQAQQNVDNTTNVPGTPNVQVDPTALKNTAEFKALPADQQEVVLQVYELIANNNQEMAGKLTAAFQTAAKISDPFFKQELRLAVDAIERGFVSIDQEEEYKLNQLRKNQQDLEQDIATQSSFLNAEEVSALRGIERQYSQTIKTTRQNLAASGFSQSSRRVEAEEIIDESTQDLRESTARKFGMQKTDLTRTLERGQRDTQSEIERLAEITKGNKLDFLRTAEAKVGSSNLPTLQGSEGISPLGGIIGDIPQRQTEDIISGAQNLIF